MTTEKPLRHSYISHFVYSLPNTYIYMYWFL